MIIDREIGNYQGELHNLDRLGNAYVMLSTLGSILKAIEVHEQQLAFAREIKDSNYEGIALSRLALLHNLIGEKEKGIMLAKQGLRVFESIGAPQVDVIHNMLKQWGVE